MASMMASCEYMLMGVLYWACTMVAFPPGPFTSMGLWVDSAESFRAFGLKLGVYSTLPTSGVRHGGQIWGGGVEKRQPGQHVVTELNHRGSCFTMVRVNTEVSPERKLLPNFKGLEPDEI